jgi:hypothetical protein
MDTEQSEPQFASLGALLAYEHRTNGAEHLNRVLAALVEAGETRREFLLQAACELKALRHQAADDVVAAALRCPSQADVAAFCPYRTRPYIDNAGDNAANIAAWQRTQQRQSQKKLERCQELLRQAGVDPEWLNGAARQ